MTFRLPIDNNTYNIGVKFNDNEYVDYGKCKHLSVSDGILFFKKEDVFYRLPLNNIFQYTYTIEVDNNS